MNEPDDHEHAGTDRSRNSNPVQKERSWSIVYVAVVANTALTILVLYLIARFYSG